MRVALFGLGYVGAVTATCLASSGHRVVGVDTDADKVAELNAGRSPVVEPGLDELVSAARSRALLAATTSAEEALREADVSLVCVGTPSGPGGSTDLSQVRRVSEEIGRAIAGQSRPHTVVVRSTVPPGTVGSVVTPLLQSTSGRGPETGLHVAMCPEFLREGTSVRDFFDPPFLVVGGTAAAISVVRELFAFLGCGVHETRLSAAESVKYACNAFHALKVSFTNEIARLYRMLEVDSRDVMEVFVQDRQLNISPAYLRPGFAFGGSCLPKDVRSLLHLARMNNVGLPVLEGALASNDMLVRDVAQRVLERIDEDGGTNRRVALLGLSFKHLTDDLRESPNVALAEILIGKGLDVAIHDPVVNMARLSGANLRYVRARLPHLQRVLHDDAASALAGARVAIVSAADDGVIDALRDADPPMVLDLHGRLGAAVEDLTGYQGVGW
ncbi:nucleotide sugar dehydrogenase [Pseudonocardia yuanmonensis]|uniref:UDP-glucose 6-dehydrogenase n=1 Tax=Pseudonocardia yuanmonensis TaxID=1095914 RepID=A0ABP8VVM2_9PSEU